MNPPEATLECFFFFASRRRHTRCYRDWSSDVCLPISDLQFQPLTPDRWRDFETLFGPSGAYGGCWCMWWRLRRKEFDRNSGERNKKTRKEAGATGDEPGR